MPPGADQEEELKLELTPYDADLLAASGLLGGEPKVIPQESVYFDTPDHALARAGLSLRIRRSGRGHKQTVKADGSAAGLLVRSEWEQSVSGNQPVLHEDNPVTALLGYRTALLAPIFIVENERRMWNLEGIEIALDHGRIVAGERSAELCEVELERKGGELAAMFALAREIEARVPARLSVLSKAERGYRLLGPAAPAFKAGNIRLTSEMTVADSFCAIVDACLGHFHRNVPAVLDCGEARALHQARVAIRRLRSALSLYSPVLQDPRTLARFKRELQWLAGKLAALREIDVLIESAAGSSGAEALLAPLSAARAKAAAAAATALRSKRCRALMLDLGEWVAIGRWRSAPGNAERRGEPVRDFAAGAPAHRRKVLRKRARHLAELDDEGRHDARKAAKKLRYAVDFFAALYPQEREDRRRKRFVKLVERLQEGLGSLNDLATAPAAMARLGLADLPTSELPTGHHDRTRMIHAATKDFGEFSAAKPFWN